MLSTGIKLAAQMAMPTPPKAPALQKFQAPKARVTASRRPGNPVPGLGALTGASEMTSYSKPIRRKMLQRMKVR